MKRDLSMDSFENFELIEEDHLMQDSFKFSRSDSSCKNPFWDLFSPTESNNNNNINNNNINDDAHIWSEELLNSIVAPEMVISEEVDNFCDEKESNSEKLMCNLVNSQNLGGEIVNCGDVNGPVECNSENLGLETEISESEDNQLSEKECNFENLEGENENVTEGERNNQPDERETDNSQDLVHEMLIERESQEEREPAEPNRSLVLVGERNTQEEERAIVSHTKTQRNERENVPSFSLMETNLSFSLVEMGGERAKFESVERETGSEMDSGCVLQDPCPLSESSPESQLVNPKLVGSRLAERSAEESPMDVADSDLTEKSANTTVDSHSNENEEGTKINLEKILMDGNNILLQNESEKENILPSVDNSDSNLSIELINKTVGDETELEIHIDKDFSPAIQPMKVTQLSEASSYDVDKSIDTLVEESTGEENDENTPEKDEIADVIMEDAISSPVHYEHEIIEDGTIGVEVSDCEEVSEKISEKCEGKISDKTLEECKITNDISKEEVSEENVSDKALEECEITNDASKEKYSEKIPEKCEEQASDKTLKEYEIPNDASEEEVSEKIPEKYEEQVSDKTLEECEITNDASKEEIEPELCPVKISSQSNVDNCPISTSQIQSEQDIQDATISVDLVEKSVAEENYESTPEISEIRNDVTMEDVGSPVRIDCEANLGTCTVNDAIISVDALVEKSGEEENYENAPGQSLIAIDAEMEVMDSLVNMNTETTMDIDELSEGKNGGDKNDKNAPEKSLIVNDAEIVERESEFSPVEINSSVNLSTEKSDGEIDAERTLEKIEITNKTEADVLNSVDNPEAKSNEEEDGNYKNAPEISDFTKDVSREVEPHANPIKSLIQSDNVMQISVDNPEENITEEKDSKKAPQVSDFTNEKIAEREVCERALEISDFMKETMTEEKDYEKAPNVSDFTKEMISEEKDREEAPEESDFTKEMSSGEKDYKKAPEESDFMDDKTSEDKEYEKTPELSDFTDGNIGEEKNSEKASELSDIMNENVGEKKDSKKAPDVSDFTDENVGEEKDYGKAPELSDFTSEKTGEEKEKAPEISAFPIENVGEEKNSENAPELSCFTSEKICEEKVSDEALKEPEIMDGKISEQTDYKKAPEIADFSNDEICEEKDSEKVAEVSDFMDGITSDEGNYEKTPEISEFTNNPSKEDLPEFSPMEVNFESSQINVDISVKKTSKEKDSENKKNSEEKDSENTLEENEVENNGNEINDETIFGKPLEQNAKNTLEKLEITNDVSKVEESASLNEIKDKMENTFAKTEISVGASNEETRPNLVNETPIIHSEHEINVGDSINEEGSRSTGDRCQATIGPFEDMMGPKIEQLTHEKSDCQNDIIGTSKEPETKSAIEKLEKFDGYFPKCPSSSSTSQVAPEESANNNESCEGKNVILPDLNASDSPKAPRVSFITEVQKIQLRAQIFVYGSLVDGTLPKKAHMANSFEQSERSMWIGLWNAYSETLKKRNLSNIGSCYTPSPSSSRLLTESMTKSPLQNNKLFLSPQISGSNLYKSPISRFRSETENPKRKRKHSHSPDSVPTNKVSPGGATRNLPLNQFASTLFWGPKPNFNTVTANQVSPGGVTPIVPARQLSSTLHWRPNIGTIRANQITPGCNVDILHTLISAAKQKKEREDYENYQIALSQNYNMQASPQSMPNQIAPSDSLENRNKEQIVSHPQSRETDYESTPHVSTGLSDEQLKIQEAFESAENIAKRANEIARLASEAALNAKLLADEAVLSLTGQTHNPFHDTLTPIKPNNNKNNDNSVDEIVSNMKEASRRRVEKAVAVSKQAENLECIMRGAELAVQVVNEAGRVIMMGDPLPFSIEDMVKEFTGGVKGKEIGGVSVVLPVQLDFESKGNGEDELCVNREERGVKKGSLVEDGLEKRSDVSFVPVQLDFGLKGEGNGEDELTVNGEERGFKKGSLVEIKGEKEAWFEATVLNVKDGMAKIQYNHISHEEEWVPIEMKNGKAPLLRDASTLKNNGNRKRRREKVDNSSWSIGDLVDAWMQNGWWEGVISSKQEDEAKYTVYFPEAGGQSSVFNFWNLRTSLIWKDGNWIEWAPLKQKNNKSNEGDSPIEKRQKVGPLQQETKIIPKPKILSKNTKNVVPVKNDTKQRSFNTRASIKERERETAKEREREQKRVRTCFGIPKPNKNIEFVKVILPSFSSSQNPKPKAGKDAIQNSNLKIDVKPQNPKPKFGTKDLGINLSLKNVEKGKRPGIEKVINKRQIYGPKGPNVNLEKKRLASSVKGQNGNLEKKNLVSSVKGRDGNFDKFGGVNENVGETSGLRRSSRKVKPTSKLLEGLESSNLMSKASSVGPRKGPISKKAGRTRQ